MPLELATIIDVDPKTYMVTVVSEADRGMPPTPIAFPYDHPEGGGLIFMPEVNSRCLLFFTEDRQDYFVMGFLPPPHDEAYRLSKPELNPGDIELSTRDGNKISVLRGGTIVVQSTPLCSTLYLPVRNTIRHMSENWESFFPGGSMGLRTLRMDSDATGTRTVFQLLCKEKAADSDASIEIFLGGTGRTLPADRESPAQSSQGDVLFEYRIGTKGALFTYSIDKAGNAFTRSAGDQVFQVGGKVIGRMRSGFALLSQSDGSIEVTGNVSLRASDSILIEALKSMTVRSPEVTVESNLIRLGTSESGEPVLRGKKFLSMFLTHTHAGNNTPPSAVGAVDCLSNRVLVD